MPNDNDTTRERGEGTAAPEAAEAIRKTVEAWESEKDVAPWLRVAARALHRWPKNRELLEHEFDAGVSAASELALR